MTAKQKTVFFDQVPVLLTLLLLLAASLLYLKFGQVDISFAELFRALFGHPDDRSGVIVLQLRLPRLVLSALSGLGFAVSGALLQGSLRNDLAEPGLIGVSSGGALLGLVAVLLFPHLAQLQLPFATCGALLAAFLVQLVSGREPESGLRLILIGAALSALLGSLCSLLLYFHLEQAGAILACSVGSLSGKGWGELKTLLPYLLLGFIWANLCAGELNIFSFGDELASSFGIFPARFRRKTLFIASLLGAGAVGAAGLLGFVGLLAPHAARLMAGGDYRKVIPLSGLLGALLVIISDLIARCAVHGMELPTGMVTSLWGPVFFIFLLFQCAKKGKL